ncbi:hypothetical protein [Sphingomonas sp. ID0503]|uniref:hypothetical protein n=1 Tax=Sphingomonas sp. ID0503 TaxID=3399691 RepID=UPI003AFB350A
MLSASARIGFKLCRHISTIEAGQPRRPRAVSVSIDAVASHAGIRCAGIAPAQGDEFTRRGELVGRIPLDLAACRQGECRHAHQGYAC